MKRTGQILEAILTPVYPPAYLGAKKVFILHITSTETMGVDIVLKDAHAGSFSEVENLGDIAESITTPSKFQPEKSIMHKDIQSEPLHATDYLHLIKPHVSKGLLSSRNFMDIKNLADHFTGGITSFFGFEYRLSSTDVKPDYLLAVSSQKGEREALSTLIKNKRLPEKFLNQAEWQNIGNFAEAWSNLNSILYDKVFGLWLEFDKPDPSSETIVPSIFLQIKPLYIDTPEDINKCTWVTRTAIPILNGRFVPEELEKNFINAIKKLPKGASVFHVASMLSRNTEGMRLIIKRIKPEQIVPYLESLGWTDENEGLIKLLEEIQKFSNCIRLHINISDHVDQKIGLECFISPDQYHQGNGWTEFLDYLVKKDLCTQDFKSALLNFPGVEQENPDHEFNLESYMPSVKLPDKNFSKAIVRYISHVKISYEPNKSTKAKAYTGVRLFGLMEE